LPEEEKENTKHIYATYALLFLIVFISLFSGYYIFPHLSDIYAHISFRFVTAENLDLYLYFMSPFIFSICLAFLNRSFRSRHVPPVNLLTRCLKLFILISSITVWIAGAGYVATTATHKPTSTPIFLSIFFMVCVVGLLERTGENVRYRITALKSIEETLDVKKPVSTKIVQSSIGFLFLLVTIIGMSKGFTIAMHEVERIFSFIFEALLAFIGFVAIVFTFGFSNIEENPVKRRISLDTRRLFVAILFVLPAALIAPIFFDKEVVFEISPSSLDRAWALAFFIFVFWSAVAIFITTVLYFINFSVEIYHASIRKSGWPVLFDETHVNLHGCSIIAYGPNGLSKLRSFLEDIEIAPQRITETLETTALIERGQVLLLMPQDMPHTKNEVEALVEFIYKGGNLIAVTSCEDVKHKADLLKRVGIEFDLSKKSSKDYFFIDSWPEQLFAESEKIDVFMYFPVRFYLKAGNGNWLESEWSDKKAQNTILFIKYGEGRLVLIGDANIFLNKEIETPGHLELIIRLLRNLEYLK